MASPKRVRFAADVFDNEQPRTTLPASGGGTVSHSPPPPTGAANGSASGQGVGDEFKRRVAATFGALVNPHSRTAARTELNERAEHEYENDMFVTTAVSGFDLREAIDSYEQPDHVRFFPCPCATLVSTNAHKVRHPERYTKYSLADVDIEGGANEEGESEAALAFLQSLRSARHGRQQGQQGRQEQEEQQMGTNEQEQRRAAVSAATRGRRGTASGSNGRIGGWRAYMDEEYENDEAAPQQEDRDDMDL